MFVATLVLSIRTCLLSARQRLPDKCLIDTLPVCGLMRLMLSCRADFQQHHPWGNRAKLRKATVLR